MTNFKKGDKVRMLNKDGILGANATRNGGVYEVTRIRDGGIYINDKSGGMPLPIFEREYHAIELVVGKPKKSDRIAELEMEVATLKAKVDAMEQASKPVGINLREVANAYETANERRADVIKRAKAYVCGGYDRWYGNKLCNVEFIVNSEKRAVVALLRGKRDTSVVSKGIAKCDPSDVFNADIGKAIALGRALGVDVTEFERAVQPTEFAVGQITGDDETDLAKTVRVDNGRAYDDTGSYWCSVIVDGKSVITEDTDAVYE